MPELPQGDRYAFNPQPDEPGVTRVTLEDVSAWRKAENEAGRPDGLLDFFKAHGICPCCKGNRRTVVGFDGTRPITAICPQCGGTGLSTPEGHVV